MVTDREKPAGRDTDPESSAQPIHPPRLHHRCSGREHREKRRSMAKKEIVLVRIWVHTLTDGEEMEII